MTHDILTTITSLVGDGVALCAIFVLPAQITMCIKTVYKMHLDHQAKIMGVGQTPPLIKT